MHRQKNPKISLAIVSFGFVILVITIVILFIIDSKKSATLLTKVVPTSSIITIDGRNYKANTSIRFEPTDTIAIISAGGYITQEIPISLLKGETNELYIALLPDNGDLSQYCINYNDECKLFEEIMQAQSSQAAIDYLQRYPISAMLPVTVVEVDPATYDWTEYRIDGGKFDNCKDNFCIKITDSTGGNKEKALQKIRDNGYDPNDYEIIYEYTPVQPLN